MIAISNSDTTSVLIPWMVSTLRKSIAIVYKANYMPIITKIICITSEGDRERYNRVYSKKLVKNFYL
jgi:hypothetical protein